MIVNYFCNDLILLKKKKKKKKKDIKFYILKSKSNYS